MKKNVVEMTIKELPPLLRYLCEQFADTYNARIGIVQVNELLSNLYDGVGDVRQQATDGYNQMIAYAETGDIKSVGSTWLRAAVARVKIEQGSNSEINYRQFVMRAAFARWVKEQCDNGHAQFLDILFNQRTVDDWLAEKSLPSNTSLNKLKQRFENDMLERYNWLITEYEPNEKEKSVAKAPVKKPVKKVVPVKKTPVNSAKAEAVEENMVIPDLGTKEPNRTPRRVEILELPPTADTETSDLDDANLYAEPDDEYAIADFFSPWQLRRLPSLHGMHAEAVEFLRANRSHSNDPDTHDDLLEAYQRASSSKIVEAMIEFWPRTFNIKFDKEYRILVSCEFFTLIGDTNFLTVIEPHENGSLSFNRTVSGCAGTAIRRGSAYFDALSSDRIKAMLKKAGFWYYDDKDVLRTSQNEFQVLPYIAFDAARFFSDADLGDDNCQIDDEANSTLCHFGEWVNDHDTDLRNLRGAKFNIESDRQGFQIAQLETPEIKVRGIVTRNGHNVRIVADHMSGQALHDMDSSSMALLEASGACVVSKEDGYMITFWHAGKEHVFEIHQ